jgi:hypothetical protein
VRYKYPAMKLQSLNVVLFAFVSLWAFGNLAHAASLSADQIADLADVQNASIQHLEADEALDQKSGIDFSTLSGSETQAFAFCNGDFTPDATTKAGVKIKMLGAALVYAAPSNGSSILGHVGERFTFCFDHQYLDAFYDYAPFDPSDLKNPQAFQAQYGVDPTTYTAEENKILLASNFEHVSINTDIGGVYGSEQLLDDRSIYEAWFKIDGATMYQMMGANADRYTDQLAKLQAHQPLAPYKLLTDDCMTPVVKDMLLINPSYISKHSPARLTPTFLYNFVKNHDVDRIIIYPSQREFRILRKQAEGKSTAFAWLLPASKDLSGGFGNSWAFVYTQTHGLLKYTLVGPATGAANMVAAAAETVVGAVTAPVILIEKLFHHKNKIPPAVDAQGNPLPKLPAKYGFGRMLQGLGDLFDSAMEVFSFQIRFPVSTDWTQEEMTFFQNFSQQSLLLNYLGAKYENAPVIVRAPLN